MSISAKRVIDARVDGASSVNVNHDFATGAASQTFQGFDAISRSSGSLEFNIMVPGQNAYWNRRVMLETTTVYTAEVVMLQGNTAWPASSAKLRYGRDFSVCGFPMNSLIQTCTASINGSTITTQQNQIMPLVRRLIASNSKTRKALGCPSGVNATADNAQTSWTVNECVATSRPVDEPASNATFRSFAFGTFAAGQFTPYTAAAYGADGGLDADSISLVDATGTGGTAGNAKTFTFAITTREPLLCAPFIIDDSQPAFTNVQAANVRLTLMAPGDPTVRILRTTRSSGGAYNIPTVTGGSVTAGTLDDPTNGTMFSIRNVALASAQPFVNAKLWCNFLSPSPDQLVPASTIYPYLQFDPLVTAQAAQLGVPLNHKSLITPERMATEDVVSQTVVLNTCPDYLAIYALLGEGGEVTPGAAVAPWVDDHTRTVYPASFSGREDLFAPIQKISIMWNNQPAILASAPMGELWRMTADNGLRVTYDTFLGVRTATKPGLLASGLGLGTQTVATTGAPLLLQINKDFPTEPGTAPGVAGVFSLTVTASVRYLASSVTGTAGAVVSRPCQLYVVPIRSTFLQLNAGGTSSVIGAISSGEGMLDAAWSTDRLLQAQAPMRGGWGNGLAAPANGSSGSKDVWRRAQAAGAIGRGVQAHGVKGYGAGEDADLIGTGKHASKRRLESMFARMG